MVKVIIDGKQQVCKEVIVTDYNSQAHKNFTYVFADEYDKADELLQKQK